jgi:hypothetical protein
VYMRATITQLKRLVGNPDAYAVQHEDGTWHPVRTKVSDTPLMDHLTHERTIGTYVLWGDKAKTLVFDLDEGDETLEQAEGIRDELVRLGVPKRSVGIEFSGQKGHHVWMVLADYVPAKELRRLGRVVLALTGLPADTEVFPKQDKVEGKDAKGKDRLGSLVKLPEGLHQKSKKENKFIGRIPTAMSVQVLNRILEDLPPEPERVSSYEGPDGVVPCLANIAAGVAYGGRNIALYHYAVLLRGSHRITDEGVEMLVRAAALKCDPPYGSDPSEEEELAGLIESSKSGGPLCSSLPESMRCGTDQCVRTSLAGGLRTRQGQLKGATVGEGVVLQIRKKTGQLVELEHPDIRAGGKVRVG